MWQGKAQSVAAMSYNARMDRRARHWSAYAWIACLAILFNAFAPVLCHALTAAPPDTVEVQVCTALGMEMMSMPVEADQSGKSAPGHLHKDMAHCACCAFHGSTSALPQTRPFALALSAGRDVYPPLYYHAARPLFPWSLAQSRAPPALV